MSAQGFRTESPRNRVANAAPAMAIAAALGVASAASADPTPQSSGEFNTPYGQGYGEQNQPFEPRTRGPHGRVVINGRILLGEESSTLGGTLGSSTMFSDDLWGTSTAIGNQLNVIVEGDWNTVIVDSTQINEGDVSAGVGVEAETSEDD